MVRFSKDYRTWTDWKQSHPENTPYNRRIVNEHKKYPDASLSQLRGHPGKRRKPVSKLKSEKEKKKPKLMQVIISANVVSDDRSMYSAQVYGEYYIKSSRTEDKIAQDIRKEFSKDGLNIWPVNPADKNEKTINIAFREKPPKGMKVVSQKKMRSDFYNKVNSSLKPAGSKSDHSKVEQAERKRRKEEKQRKLRERYDNNEI